MTKLHVRQGAIQMIVIHIAAVFWLSYIFGKFLNTSGGGNSLILKKWKRSSSELIPDEADIFEEDVLTLVDEPPPAEPCHELFAAAFDQGCVWLYVAERAVTLEGGEGEYGDERDASLDVTDVDEFDGWLKTTEAFECDGCAPLDDEAADDIRGGGGGGGGSSLLGAGLTRTGGRPGGGGGGAAGRATAGRVLTVVLS